MDDTRALFHIDPDKDLYIETDASDEGFGAILYQMEKGADPLTGEVFPYAYYSHKWDTSAQENYETCTKELLGLKSSIEKWSEILQGMPFTIVTDNDGVFGLLKRAREPKRPTKRSHHERWLDIISMHQVVRVIKKKTNEVFTSDGLSRSFWQDKAVNEDDPRAWPMFPVTDRQNKEADLQVEAIQRQVINHCRHHNCSRTKRGLHPWADLLAEVRREVDDTISEQQLKEALSQSPRAIVTKEGAGAAYGHTRGTTPTYSEYLGNTPLYHHTTERRLPNILTTGPRGGLRSFKRKYVHLASNPEPKSGGRTKAIEINPVELRQKGLRIFRTTNSKVYLCPGPIPVEVCKYNGRSLTGSKRDRQN